MGIAVGDGFFTLQGTDFPQFFFDRVISLEDELAGEESDLRAETGLRRPRGIDVQMISQPAFVVLLTVPGAVWTIPVPSSRVT